jgi:hypothetical protein
MKKLTTVSLVLVLLVGMVPAFAQQPAPTPPRTGKWFFLMSGAAGGFSTNVFVVAGPFKDQADCDEINEWSKKQGAKVSRCWYSGE